MKRLLLIMLAAALIVSGCAKNADKSSEEASPEASQTQSTESKSETKTEEKSEEKSKTETVTVPGTIDLEGVINEFNTTKDEKRKEELRIQLEEFFKQAEGQTITVKE